MAITLYTAGTPNGIKISAALELLHLAYKVVPIDFSKNEQKEDWYLKICPNGRIPAIVDTDGPKKPDGSDFTLFESGAILQYLADTYDKDHKISYPKGTELYYRSLEWLLFQNAGIGPMQGQASHFIVFAKEEVPYAIKRYSDEARRLYSVLEKQIVTNGTGYIVGDHISIADLSTFAWIGSSYRVKIDLEKEFPDLYKWFRGLLAIEELRKGTNVPSTWAAASNWGI